jgi:hypothetical protein
LLKTILEGVQKDSNKCEFFVYKDSYITWLKGYIIASFDGDNTFIQNVLSKTKR